MYKKGREKKSKKTKVERGKRRYGRSEKRRTFGSSPWCSIRDRADNDVIVGRSVCTVATAPSSHGSSFWAYDRRGTLAINVCFLFRFPCRQMYLLLPSILRRYYIATTSILRVHRSSSDVKSARGIFICFFSNAFRQQITLDKSAIRYLLFSSTLKNTVTTVALLRRL